MLYRDMQILTGDLKIHKSDAGTRPAKAALVIGSGSLMVWDDVPLDRISIEYPGSSPTPIIKDIETGHIIEPDIVVDSTKWQRVEREGHSWMYASTNDLMQEAKERDDVDEDEFASHL